MVDRCEPPEALRGVDEFALVRVIERRRRWVKLDRKGAAKDVWVPPECLAPVPAPADVTALCEAGKALAAYVDATITQPEDIPEGQPGRQYGAAEFKIGDLIVTRWPNSYGVAIAAGLLGLKEALRAALARVEGETE